MDAAFVATNVAPRDGDAVVLRAAGGAETPIGEVRLLDSRTNVGVAIVPGLELTGALRLHATDGREVPRGPATLLMGAAEIPSYDGNDRGFFSHIQFGGFPNQHVGILLDIGFGWRQDAWGENMVRYAPGLSGGL